MTTLIVVLLIAHIALTVWRDREMLAFHRTLVARLRDVGELQAKTVTAVTALPPPVDHTTALRGIEAALLELRSDQKDADQRISSHLSRVARDLDLRIEGQVTAILRAVAEASNEVLQAQISLHSDFTTIREEVVRLTNQPAPVAPPAPTPKPRTPAFPPGLVEAAAAKGVSPEQLRDLMAEALGI